MKQGRPFAFSLIHTTARPWGSAGSVAHDVWLDACVDPKGVEYVVTVDKADEKKWPGFHARANAWGRTVFAVNEKRPCPVDGWNKAAEVSTGHFLITVSDDILPCPRWDEEIKRAVPDMSKEVVLDVNFGPLAFPGFLFFNFMTRARYEKIGYLFHTDYFGYKADDHFTMESERDGVIVKARHLVFKHLHPDYGLSPLDEVYQRQKSRDLAGQQAFNRHWGAGSYQDFLRQRDAPYIIRPTAQGQQFARKGQPELMHCPHCRSTRVETNCGQLQCRSCSLIFPASLLLEPAASASPSSQAVQATARPVVDPKPSELDALRSQITALTHRVEQLEKQVCGKAKGDIGWSESALRN